jgi:hypothetical protein
LEENYTKKNYNKIARNNTKKKKTKKYIYETKKKLKINKNYIYTI